LYRYWNPGAGDHFYTTNWGELGSGRYGWNYEGIQCYVFPNVIGGSPQGPAPSETPTFPDPAVERYKRDIDRTLIRENLKLTHEERLTQLMRLQDFAAELRRAGRALQYTVATTGFSSMALTLVVLLSYQSTYGYLYERVGLLTASFMAGGAIGALLARDHGRPLRLLQVLEAATVLLLPCVPWLLRSEPLFLLVAVTAGAAGGAVFAAAAAGEGRRGTAGSAGLLYALDLAGSFAGALMVAVFLVPVLGMHRTLLFVAALKVLSLAALLTVRYEEA